MLYAYVSVAVPSKHEYLRRFIRVAEIPTPATVVQWVLQGAIEWM